MGNLVDARARFIVLGMFAILGCRTDVVGLVKAGATESSATEDGGTTTDSEGTGSGWNPDDDCTAGPPGTGACPLECSGGCEDGTCTIRCDSLSPCADDEVVCPQDWPCVVQCVDEGSCNDTEVRCADRGCDLVCNAPWSCDPTFIVCGEGPCTARCIEGGGSLYQDCDGACRCYAQC